MAFQQKEVLIEVTKEEELFSMWKQKVGEMMDAVNYAVSVNSPDSRKAMIGPIEKRWTDAEVAFRDWRDFVSGERPDQKKMEFIKYLVKAGKFNEG